MGWLWLPLAWTELTYLLRPLIASVGSINLIPITTDHAALQIFFTGTLSRFVVIPLSAEVLREAQFVYSILGEADFGPLFSVEMKGDVGAQASGLLAC